MSDLTLQKWDSVIVDWVNCLEIAKRIQNISALKSGEFFKAILDILQPELHTTLSEFLCVHYPHFRSAPAKVLREYTDTELTIAASLLLHFMCIHDRRDELIAPLCQKLTGAAQTYIKSFLEHFADDTTAAGLFDVVSKAVNGEPLEDSNRLCTPKTGIEWNSSGESPFVCHSPLFEYFKTPAAKTAKMQEKDREIRRLMQELQLERDEKEDMNVELAEQRSRIQKISSEVREKSVTITNLTARLTELEELPPTNKPREVIEIEKLLRLELADAQQYICELQVDHGELFEKRQEMLQKLAKAEETTCIWQERTVQLESKLEQSLSNYRAQHQELTNLQVNYNELSTLLEELRQNNVSAAHFEMDTSATQMTIIEPKSPEENLASTVVEIQLKECRMEMQELQSKLSDQDAANRKLEATIEELVECRRNLSGLEAMKYDVDVTLDKYILTNEKLEKKINQLAKECSDMSDNNKRLEQSLAGSVESSQKLEDDLIEVKAQLDDVNNNHQQLENRNEELMEKLVSLQQSEESLMRTNVKIVAEVEQLTHENIAKETELDALKSNLIKREETIEKNEEIFASLNQDLEKIEQARSEFEDKLEQKNRMYSILEEESKALQQQYEETVDAFNQADFNLLTLQKQIKENDNKFQVSLDKLDAIITGSIQSSNMEKWRRIETLLAKLDEKQMTFESTIDNLKQLTNGLEERCEAMCKEGFLQQDNYEKVQTLLDESQERVRKFESEVKLKIERITTLEDTINCMEETINQLESQKAELSGRLDEVQEDNSKLTENISMLSLTNDSLTSMIDEKDRQLSNFELLRQDWENKIRNVQAVNSDREIANSKLEKHVVDLQTAVKDLEQTKETLLGDLETNKKLSEEHAASHQELKVCFDDSLMEISTLQSDNASLKRELTQLQSVNASLMMQQEQLQSLHLELTGQYEELVQRCKSIEADRCTLERESLEQQTSLNNDISCLHKEKAMLKEDISKLESCNTEWAKRHQEFESEHSLLCSEMDDLKKQHNELGNKNVDLSKHIDELSAKCESIEKESTKQQEALTADICNLQKENVSLKENVNEIMSAKQVLEKETSEKITNLNSDVSNLQNENSYLKNNFNDLQNTHVEVVKKCEFVESEKHSLVKETTEQINSLNNEVSNLQNENSLLKNNLDDMENSNHNWKTQYSELETKHTEIIKKCESIESEKQDLVEVTDERINTLTSEKSMLINNLSDLQNSKDNLKLLHDELQTKHDEVTKKCEMIEFAKHSLENETTERINNLNNNVTTLQSENVSLKNNLSDLETSNDNWRTQHDELQTRKAEIVQKCELITSEKLILEKETTGQIKLLNNNVSDLENKNESLNENLQDVESKNIELQNEVQKLSEKCELTESAKQALSEETSRSIKSLNVEIASLQEENSSLKNDVYELQVSNDNWLKQHEELHILNVELSNRIEKLAEKCEQIQSDKDSYTMETAQQMQSLQNENSSLQNDVQYLKVSNTNWGEQHAELQYTNMGLSKQIEELVQKCNTIESAKQASENESTDHMKTLNDSISSLQSELSCAYEENTFNKKTIGDLMIEIDSQLFKLKGKDSELCIVKEEYFNRDLERQQTINKLNHEVANLDAVKHSLETDLQMTKDDCALKQQELEELRRSKSQLEKELSKKLRQHEKKVELMQLAIDNLQKRTVELEKSKHSMASELEEETRKLVAITAEKGKLSGEHNQTKNELTALKQQLASREQECARKDDVIDEHSKELFALKLDIEVKTSELLSCMVRINELDQEKSDAFKSAHELKDELKKLNAQHKNTVKELKAITDMKNSLSMKMDLFKENMQAIFTHFDIKKKNMKQSLEELKKYKGLKEAEINAVNLELNEIRAGVERMKEENHSALKELQQRVDTKTKEVKQLEYEVEALRTTESGCLQEISMLKEELNYTIDRYSEALSTEKEQKAENDLHIQNLTESLHEMLEKFNGLDKEHKELTIAMKYNKKVLEEMQTERDCLELQIVKLKHEYEDDATNCKAEFLNELNTLKKIEKSLKVEVQDLKSVLEKTANENSTVSRELQDAKSHLHIIQCERAELVNKMDELELSKVGLRKDYESLKIVNEEYMKESKAALIEKHDQLLAEKEAHEKTVAQKDKEIGKLKKDVTKCLERLKREEEMFKKDIEKRQTEIQELHTSIANFLSNIETLTKEKDALSKKIEDQEKYCQKLGQNNEEKDATILLHEKQLQNLQISHDVLEAGKIKMENMQADLQGRLAAQEKQMRSEKQKFEAGRSSLQTQLEKTQAQLRESEQLVKQKNAELEAANEECESVQSILTNMSKKMEATSRQLAVIHEDYEGKLKFERESFRELKEQYDTTSKELEYMGGLTDGLRIELDEVRRERADAEMAIQDKEETIADLQRKYDAVVNQVGAKDATIASLQAELAVGVERLADAADARHALEDELRRAAEQLAQVEAQKAGLIEAHACTLRAVEENLLRTEREVGAVMARLDDAQMGWDKIEGLLAAEREAKAFLERRVVDVEAQVLEANVVKAKLSSTIRRIAALLREKDGPMDEEELDDVILKTEQQIIVVFGKLRDLGTIKHAAERDRDNAQRTLEQMDKCNRQLTLDKEKLLENFEKLHEEKAALIQDKSEESRNYKTLLAQHELLREQNQSSSLLEQKLEQLEGNNKKQSQHYIGLQRKLQEVLNNVETLVNERNQLEQVVYHLRDQYSTLQIKSSHITEASHKLHFEQKTALEVIIDDICKQFRRVSKMIYNLNIKCHQVADKSVSAILDNKLIDWITLFNELTGEEIFEKLEDLKDNANNTQVQLESFMTSIEALVVKEEKPRVLKENMQPLKQQPKEEEWRKKYLSVKQKLTLVENAKNNFEKKIKQLRDENKKLVGSERPVKVEIKQEMVSNEAQSTALPDSDKHYKKLLQEYIHLKEDHENDLSLWKHKCERLECELSKSNSKTSLQSDLQTIEDLQSELNSLRGSYREVKIAFSKLQLDYSALEQLLSERNDQLASLNSAKDGYSNIGEENTKLKSEIDTLKYKRQRDRDKFMQHIEKEEAELAKKMQAVRAEYDLKLDKMKEKIVCKYKEQVDQNESQRYDKLIALKTENEHYKCTVQMLKEELGRIQARNAILDSEKQLVMQDLKVAKGREGGDFDFKEPASLSRRGSSHSLHSEMRTAYVEERRSTFSLPRNAQAQHAQMGVIEEVHYRRLSNVAPVPTDPMEMEDEGEMFNNKYLHDLKEGRPSFAATGRESSSSRLSEFAYRNSLCPPHLKSSYPAETQFLDHRFKEDDLKSGNIDFDDCMKTQLLPTEKHKKKDAGTTSYKRPGPPTPSKHGGRLSLQGNERVLRENGDSKRTAANPLRSLFSSSSKKVAATMTTTDSATTGIGENSGTTSPKKRPSLSFFRR